MFDPELYTISIRKELFDEDTFYVARIAELPDVMEFGDTLEEARTLAIETIETAYEMFEERGMSFPTPQAFSEELIEASGRVTLRLPKSLHAQAIREAEKEGASLNTYLISVISEGQAKQSTKAAISNDIVRMFGMLKSEVISLRSDIKGYRNHIEDVLSFSVRTPVNEYSWEDATAWVRHKPEPRRVKCHVSI